MGKGSGSPKLVFNILGFFHHYDVQLTITEAQDLYLHAFMHWAAAT